MHELYKTLPMYEAKEGMPIAYPEFIKLTDEQMHGFWPHNEPLVENDVPDLRTRLTPAELNGITQTLRLFTKYERHVGEDYWSGRIVRTFRRPEFTRMGTWFAAVEENSHAPFYDKVNEVLSLNTEEFYESWKESEALSERVAFIGKCVSDPDDARSFAAFTFIEGAVLYSSFAYLKHFQSQECGKNLIRNICRGVDLSVVEEHQHSIGGAMLFHTLCREMKEKYDIDVRKALASDIFKMAATVYEHESAILDIIFAEPIEGISADDIRMFVKSRINLCLENLGYDDIYEIGDNPVAKWFYKSITSKKLTDFFTGNGSEYNINHNRTGFSCVWE
ncbi:MAG: ribonucleotide-diphosphate reductase subunit beta [Bacilli bacterium]